MKLQLTLVAALCFAGVVHAQDEAAPPEAPPAEAPAENPQPSLDEQIFGPDNVPAEEGDAIDPLELDDNVKKLLTGEEAADLFKEVIGDMDRATSRLRDERDAGLPTQRLQEEILKKLDQVIATAEQQQQQGQGQGSGGQGQPRQQDAGSQQQANAQQQQQGQGQNAGQAEQAGAGENAGNYSPGDVAAHDNQDSALGENEVEWGNLPPRLRDELQQGFSERYSPIFKDLTEAYYRRLAEEGR